jgi:Ca-activated chloride channel family protein
MRRAAGVVLVALLAVVPAMPAGATAPAAAAGVRQAGLLVRTAAGDAAVPAPVQSTEIEMRITGPIARATVRQTFDNPAGAWAEGVYVFPLPETAAVDHLTLRVGDRVIEGRIQERVAAKATYEQARAQGQRVSLVEQERPNIFTTSVANIAPGASIVVEIQYQQTVHYDAGRFHLRVPLVVGPRYVPAAAGDAGRITPPVQRSGVGLLNPVTLRIALDPGLPVTDIESPHHAIRAVPLGGEAHEVTLADGVVPADRDFELTWRPVGGAAPGAVLLTEPHGSELFALLMIVPPTEGSRLRVPREVVFVLDHSGSMAGASIERARAALGLALERLRPGDTFNVIGFSDTTSSLFFEAREASRAHLHAAAGWIEGIRAQGGTVMLPALRRALDGVGSPGRLRQVIFLTDGAVGNEAQLFAEIRGRLGESRLFTIGIGSAPNSHFMREAARLGRGSFTHIGSPGEVQQKMTALFRKLESPALADVALELPDVPAVEIFPSPIPDLYLGEPVVVALRTSTLPLHAVLRGQLGVGPWEHQIVLRQAAPGAGLAVQWARAKIDALLDARATGAAPDVVRTAVVDVALRHHLVSRYTSLVAVDVTPVRQGDAALHRHALPTNLPHGWQDRAVAELGQGATGAPLHLLAGGLALLAALALGLARRRPAPLPWTGHAR